MKQSNNNKKSRDVTAFLYERLSRDDNMDGESYSIGNQKKLLIKVAKEKGYTNLVHFFDDGISGVTMDRPGFADMIQQLEQGKAAAVFVKDLSRLGRNYIEVGRETRRSSISTAPTTRAIAAPAAPRTMSEWTFWSRSFSAKSVV